MKSSKGLNKALTEEGVAKNFQSNTHKIPRYYKWSYWRNCQSIFHNFPQESPKTTEWIPKMLAYNIPNELPRNYHRSFSRIVNWIDNGISKKMPKEFPKTLKEANNRIFLEIAERIP